MMNFRKQIGFLKGLCKGLSYQPDSPESKLILSIIDTLDAFSVELERIKDDIDDVCDDIQDLSDEIGELESISEDIESLEEQIDNLGDTLSGFSDLYDGSHEGLVKPVVSRPIRLVTDDEDDDDDEFDDDFDIDDDEDESFEVSVKCPKCGEKITITDENITVE